MALWLARSVAEGTAQCLEEILEGGSEVGHFRLGPSHPALACSDDAVGQAIQAIEPGFGTVQAPLALFEAALGPRKVRFKLCLLLDDEAHRVFDPLPFPLGQAFLRTALGLVPANLATL